MIAPAQSLPIEVPTEPAPAPAEAIELVAALLLSIVDNEGAEVEAKK